MPTSSLTTAWRSLLAAFVLAAALPATAATITIKNCSGETQRIELRAGTGSPSEGAAISIIELYHPRTASASCGISPSCWVKVRPGESNEVNTVSAAEICLFQAQSSRPVTTVLADCGCQ